MAERVDEDCHPPGGRAVFRPARHRYIEYEQAKAHIEDCLALAGDCHAIYMSIDDELRRIANQVFFDKLIVLPEDGIVGEPGEPFDALFNPDV
ncbi:hypothetical protein [Pseudactinotalea sp. Z1748]|uniref:hypothetical protein n=1 Tax=Pseudactinotalea sp. Z1748 TaxID=3413027 RepID=UPI003C7D01E3